ncbi:hypothetical protein F5Y02DRAFT_432197 [Annulohypoxylon stygium]|nr:hypothetical protein F5Y02DRAFT_432197 [Annulohypoxylon stygium]
MPQPPFTINVELCNDLELITLDGRAFIRRTDETSRTNQVDHKRKDYLPGDPRIRLDDETISLHLKEELETEILNRLSPHLWLVAKQDSSHISSLTHQVVRGRMIIVTDQPRLHLVWYHDRVFIKPLPKYLLSHAFWMHYLISSHSPIQEPLRTALRIAALGFLRSYVYLIRRRSDFDIAMKESQRLLPKRTKFAKFLRLATSLGIIEDDMVSPRYHYGELRLSRLNFWIKIFLFQFSYHKPEGQYALYFARFYAPILFLFGIFSIILSTMQLTLATMRPIENPSSLWLELTLVFRGFAIFVLFIVTVIISYILVTFMSLALREVSFALKDLCHKGWPGRQINTASSTA